MDMYVTWQVAGLTLLTAAIGLTTVVVFTRLNGLRSFAKMAPHDFATTVAIGSVLAGTAMTSVPLTQGIAALAGLYVTQRLYRVWRQHGGDQVMDNAPRLLMIGSEVQWPAMRATGVTVDDLRAKLREANVLRYDQIRAVVFETTGDIAVLHGDVDGPRLDPDLLAGVDDVELEGDMPDGWAVEHPTDESPLSEPEP